MTDPRARVRRLIRDLGGAEARAAEASSRCNSPSIGGGLVLGGQREMQILESLGPLQRIGDSPSSIALTIGVVLGRRETAARSSMSPRHRWMPRTAPAEWIG